MTNEDHYLELRIQGPNIPTPIVLLQLMVEGSITNEDFAPLQSDAMGNFRNSVTMEQLVDAIFQAQEIGGEPITYGPPTYDWAVDENGQEVQIEIPGKPNRADQWKISEPYPSSYFLNATLVEIESMAEAATIAARNLANSIWMQQVARPSAMRASAPEVTE